MSSVAYGPDVSLTVTAASADVVIASADGLNGYRRDNMAPLARAIHDAGRSGAALVAIRARGANFCIGAAADLLVDMRGMATAACETFIRQGQDIPRAVRGCPAPVVACVDGFVAGGGFDLMLACDAILVGPRARLNLFYARLALLPDHGALFFLEERLGRAAAWRFYADNRTLSPQAAVDAGICDAFDCDEGDLRVRVERAMGLPLATLAARKVSWQHEHGAAFERHLAGIAQAQAALIADPEVGARVERVRAAQAAKLRRQGGASDGAAR
jgi:2-(1,2-epoxy-1,2-dihydrophenyl)acetyl-CoA isomerase